MKRKRNGISCMAIGIYCVLGLFPYFFAQFLILKYQNMESKLRCNFNSTTLCESSNRDVVFFFATSWSSGFDLAIKSLRSTGAKCRIVLFVPSRFFLNYRRNLVLNLLNIEIIKDCNATNGRNMVPHMIRYEYEKIWLEKHIGEIDRVFHTDTFDVFFQGDPFCTSISNESLAFVIEPHLIRSCGWNTDWISRCYGSKELFSLRHEFIICSGSIAGPAYQYLQLLNLMISQKHWESCWENSMDQPILNYLVWKGVVKEKGIKYHFVGCDSGFFTVQWCVLEREIRYNEHGQVISLMNTVPAYVHQYNRVQPFSTYLYSICNVM